MGQTDRARKVFFVTHRDEWIGPNISLYEIVTRLPSRYEPVIGMPGGGPFSEALEAADIEVEKFRRLDKFGTPALAAAMVRHRADLVYGNSASGVSKNALVAAKATRRPFIYHLREMAGKAGWRKVRFLRYADAVIAVSEATARSYAPYLRRPADVIHNGVPFDRMDPVEADCGATVREELGVPPDAVLVIHAGAVYPRKGQTQAVEAFASTASDHPDAHLLLIGRLDRNPAYVLEVEELAARTAVADRIHLTGFRADVARLMAASDVFLHTAVEDPHPRVVIEAMAAGLPVVALPVDGVVETVVAGETGFLAASIDDTEDAARLLDTVLSDRELRLRLGRRGREKAVDEFSAEDTARKVVAVLDRVLDGE